MATAKGTYQRVVLVEEVTQGTTPGTPSGYVIPISGYSGDVMRQNLIENPEIRGNRNPSAPVLGNISVSFGLDVTLHLDAIGWLLKHCVGVPETTGAGPTYTHTSKAGFNATSVGDLPAGLSMEIGFDDITQYLQMVGCRVDTMDVSVTPEGVSTFSFGFVGMDFDANGTEFDAAPTEYTSSALSEFSATIEEGGASIAYVTAVDFSFSNQHDTSMYTVGGAGTLAELPEGPVMVSGSVTALFRDLTLLNKAINNTESSLQLTWTSGSHSLEISIPELVYEPAAPTASGDRGVLITLPFKAYYQDGADASAFKTVLINDVTSY